MNIKLISVERIIDFSDFVAGQKINLLSIPYTFRKNIYDRLLGS